MASPNREVRYLTGSSVNWVRRAYGQVRGGVVLLVAQSLDHRI